MLKALDNIRVQTSISYHRDGLNKTLFLSCCFSILLVVVRIFMTGSMMFTFLIWNLFLAYIPFAISNWLQYGQFVKKNRSIFFLFFLVWLVFIPNAFYIVTDLFHLEEGILAPRWFNLALIFSFAWNGILFAIISLSQMENMIGFIFPTWRKWIFVNCLMLLNGLGIYVGRYLRFNSWDIIVSPFQLAGDILYLCIHPGRNVQEWGMIVCFSTLMMFVYQSVRKLGQLIP